MTSHNCSKYYENLSKPLDTFLFVPPDCTHCLSTYILQCTHLHMGCGPRTQVSKRVEKTEKQTQYHKPNCLYHLYAAHTSIYKHIQAHIYSYVHHCKHKANLCATLGNGQLLAYADTRHLLASVHHKGLPPIITTTCMTLQDQLYCYCIAKIIMIITVENASNTTKQKYA